MKKVKTLERLKIHIQKNKRVALTGVLFTHIVEILRALDLAEYDYRFECFRNYKNIGG